MVGRLVALIRPLGKEYKTCFFFPFYHTGGAEKVHALLTQATGDKNCIIYFTRKSKDKTFYNDFEKSGCVIKDISRYTDSKSLYFLNLIFRGIVSGYINNQQLTPIVFNGQCNFGYKISPWVKKGIPQIELIHSFNTFSWIRIPFLPFISKTVMISRVRIEDHLKQYKRIKVPQAYKPRIQYIVNGIPLPSSVKEKDVSDKIKVLYVGRQTEEKRVYLVAQMASRAAQQQLPVEFVFMGDVQAAIPGDLKHYCTLLGQKSDEHEIDGIYQQSHAVIITSSTEGFPIAVEEGMARGCAVVATPVGDIPIHVKDKVNGFLFSSATDETTIIDEGVKYLTLLSNNRTLLTEMGSRNIEYARKIFSIEAFSKSYRHLFNQLRSK